jgi:hypothetical protein
MSIAFFTSMDLKYYNHCGKAMLESFNAQYKKEKIIVYNEGDFEPNIKSVVKAGWNLGTDYKNFIKRWEHNSKITTFAKKGFSIVHAMNNVNCDKLVWLDADTVLTLPIHQQLIEFMCPDDTLSAHFKVKHFENNITYSSCETGFFILNKKHKNFEEFKNIYTGIYVNDEHKNLRRFYDGEVYGETVRRLEEKRIKMQDLNPGGHKTPISRSLLAPYFLHLKAGLKDNVTNEIIEERYLKKENEV